MTRTNLRAQRLLAALVGAVAVAVVFGVTAFGAGTATVKLWFLQGEQMIAVERPGTTAEDAIEQLLAGPTAAELRRGIRTYVPDGTTLRRVVVRNGVATVDLGVAFVAGRDSQSLLARLSQVVHTATGPEGAQKVRLLIKGGTPLGIFPGAFTAGPISVEYLETPHTRPQLPPEPKAPPVLSSVRLTQQRLVELGYLTQGDVDGQLGPATQTAILAFQKWEGRGRDGILGPATLKRLRTATRPEPVTRGGAGKRAEVLLDRQVALAIENNRVVRVIHVSSGKASTPTPPGTYKVYAKFAKWWSVPFREWLLWAVPFNGGIAFHEFPEAPAYPASHGCVRESHTTAKWWFDFSEVGMPVKVVSSSR